jgi:hypothetical protein
VGDPDAMTDVPGTQAIGGVPTYGEHFLAGEA